MYAIVLEMKQDKWSVSRSVPEFGFLLVLRFLLVHKSPLLMPSPPVLSGSKGKTSYITSTTFIPENAYAYSGEVYCVNQGHEWLATSSIKIE